MGQSSFQQPIEVILQSSGSYEDLDILANKVIQKTQASKIVTNLESDLKLNTPELTVIVDRDKISSIGAEEGLEVIEAIVKEIAPPEIQLDYMGTAREFRESKQTIYFVFGLALCFIYLVLAAQFESFIDPLIILFSVPLAITGALLTLKLAGGTLNIYTQIGLITLIGLITKHGILIVEFSNQLQEKGLNVTEAILQASLLRLRPILMTTSAMVLGALPLAFASGAGGVTRSEIGWVIRRHFALLYSLCRLYIVTYPE